MIIVILIVTGLCFGSFINALVWRIYKQEELGYRTKKLAKKSKSLNYNVHRPTSIVQSPNYSILKGRSMCPNCNHTLSAKDLIPVFSWLSLGGKCRYCSKPISYQYPLVELLTALLFIGSYLYWPINLTQNWQYLAFVSWLMILVGLIALAIYDVKWMILPDRVLFPLIIFSSTTLLVQFVMGRPIKDMFGIVLAVAVGCGFFGLIYVISKGKWIGFGDVKLAILLGLIVATPLNMFITLFLSSILGMFCIMPLLLVKKLKPTSHIAFGPFLISACIIVVIFGANIVNLYHNLLLI